MRVFPLIALLFFLAVSVHAATLSVTTQGQGYVSSSPSGILCGAACTETYDAGTSITLTATPQGGAFQGWSGACSGTQTTCTVTLDGPKSVTATFAGQTLSEYELMVQKSGDGSGTVLSEPYGIQLGTIAPYDSAKFQAGASVVLTASVQAGSRFDGWLGSCSGTKAACTVKMDTKQSVTAIFSLSSSPVPTATPKPSATPLASPSPTPSPTSKPTIVTGPVVTPAPKATAAPTPAPDFELTIVKSGTGLGAIYAWPSGRSQQLCGSSDKQCAYTYPFNTSFSFQVIPRPDSQFEGWTGDCQGQVCELTLDRAKKLTASFGLAEIKKPVPETVPITPPKNDGPAPTPPYIPRPTPTLKPPAEGNYPLIVQVTGKGTVKSPDGRVQCSEYCENKYARFSEIPLSAKPAEGWKFVGWGGSCLNAEGPECTVTVEGSALFVSSTTVRAVFEPETRVLSVGIEGDGWVHSGDTRIFCGTSGRIVYICAGYYPFESRIELTARASGGSTFERWEGACTGQQPQCAVVMDASKRVRAIFKGPPSRKKLSLNIPSVAGGSIFVMAYEPGSRIPLQECTSNCSREFKHGAQIALAVRANSGYVWTGFSGSCIGKPSECVLTMDSDRTVTASFYKAEYHKVTVVKPQQGTVVSVNSDAIRCGPYSDRCATDLDTRTMLLLKFEGVEGDYGLFEAGCSSILKKIDQWNRPYEECVLNPNQDRIVKTKLSPEQAKRIVGTAMGEAFGMSDYPGLRELATRENEVPFQYAFAAFQSGRAGKNLDEMRAWVKNNWDSILKETGIGKFMQDYDIKVVRTALHKTFNPDIEAYKPKPWFKADAAYDYTIRDTSQKPFIRAMREWRSMHKKPVSEYERVILYLKQSFFKNEGIEPFFVEPPPAPLIRATPPTLTQIRADDDQIGRPITFHGTGLLYTQQVSIDGQNVGFYAIDDRRVYLPKVRWGISPDFGPGSVITLKTPSGVHSLTLQASQIHATTKNADGKEEECFGAIGKGCKGTEGVDKGDAATNMLDRAGCFAVKDGKRECYISAGSIRHDNCCTWNPGGKWCGGTGTDGKPAEEWNHNGKCADEWHQAFWDSAAVNNWMQSFSVREKPDMSPYPSPNKRYFAFESKASARLCAPRGEKMREAKDAPFCCSGSLNYWNDCT